MLARLIRGIRSSTLLYYKKSLYNVLGVSKSATDSEIKQAYFSLAKKYHPDVNKDPQSNSKFSEISSAYETLGSKEKRKAYDITGKTENDQMTEETEEFYTDFFTRSKERHDDFGFYNRNQESFVNLEEMLFEFDDIIRDKKRTKRTKADNLKANVGISFMEAVKGVEKQIMLERKQICRTCKGTKSKHGNAKAKCGNCKGAGIVIIDYGIFRVQQTCHKCRGEGSKIKAKCTDCKGTGLKTNSVMETVRIPAGVNIGAQLKVSGKGHLSPDLETSGDLFVKVTVYPHKVFKRSGFDVYADIRISLAQSILGGLVEIETLDGITNLKVEPGTVSGQVYKMPGQGIVNFPINQKKGDAIYTLYVETPKSLNDKQRELYKELAEDNI